MVASASVVVRTRDGIATAERALRAVRAQTVTAELVVVDSGSTDGTLELAHRLADTVVELAPADYTPGRALNLGAAAATGDVHLALSSHSVPLSAAWIEDSLRHYRRPDVAGTNFGRLSPTGRPIGDGGHLQTLHEARAYPLWGFSNHGSSWRASTWRTLPFREDLPASEDREWSWRVLADGWTIAYAPGLEVTAGHRRAAGLGPYARRIHVERATLMALGGMAPPTLRESLEEWWQPDQLPGYPSLPWRRVSPFRLVEIAATYAAGWSAAPAESRHGQGSTARAPRSAAALPHAPGAVAVAP